ncbi:hypothetical protein L6164_003584 [Bauhinia variegata]|uniref:Uncharacterized protein n=1 Tax=Bauhinia variegata TaxID=167791 RepID=A0ACB9Q770_BAUVA|nr:hypothetical protein L6164_003584 [Bauhinia variegata]
MSGKFKQVKRDQEPVIKGPWNEEADEILINHVNEHGPKDWSSIRSKGLLQRTGKSCRLRWVNKLRPNLKNGCKFSIEQERVVIELKAEFGNKWARIAAQNKLARILQTPATSSKSQKNKTRVATSHDAPALEAPKFSSSSKEEPSPKAQSWSPAACSIENPEEIKMVALPDLMNSNMLVSDTSILFPRIPKPETDVTFPMDNQDLIARTDEANFNDVFGSLANYELEIGSEFPFELSTFEPLGCCRMGRRDVVDNPANPESFFDDFPADMFDDMEPPLPPPLPPEL